MCNYVLLFCLLRQHKCELFHALFSSLLSSAPVYLTMYVHSITFLVYQPFKLVMEKSGVKTRSSEQTMLLAEADILLVTDSSLEEDSEADDQSYYPPGVYAQTWQGYITHIMHMLYCNAYFLHHIHNIECHLLS